jgi:hypothetical protein
MKTCIECLNLDLQANPKHAQVGFGHCIHTATGAFYSFRHPICERFKQAPEEIVEKRIQFEKSLTTKEK